MYQEKGLKMQKHASSIFEKTIRRLIPKWRDAQVSKRKLGTLSMDADLGAEDVQTLRKWMDACLASEGGEVAARMRAATLGRNFLGLNSEGRIHFLTLLSEQYCVDETAVEAIIKEWTEAASEQRTKIGEKLRDVLEPGRMKLLMQFNELPEGVKFLVDMRAELLSLRKEYPTLAPLEADLKRLLTTWFDVGFLQLERISWNSSAQLLEKLIAYEAVHAIQSWSDLKNRLDSDRRCFAFFHPNMPNEPLIFVEVALVNGIADNVQNLLDEDAPVLDVEKADTAIFYSISNAQQGLAGISFGNFLIKRVVKLLQQEFPHLKNFATLSPVPGFARWLAKTDKQALLKVVGAKTWLETHDFKNLSQESLENITDDQRVSLQSLIYHYLVDEKRKGHSTLDPVAHFHLSNGAELARMNWMGDNSAKGLKQAAGMMVNYLYEVSKIEERSQRYTTNGDVAISNKLKKQQK